ncbi:uncharacterized protein LACBIDRAFT_295801 [Laccaria bicolor S238N-H82]|uniref:Predicted protein n=1 Tax=Laccaria bicolor (strain S238N-H82 / ATCC MYA-4686) TaxID=486041 RepID=B0DYK2_LACBS|nr:uncharacterized protein LACBIDRAFT_295801 [Laccaria bicolor S238N-H82]EDR00308.1 predicted protein [Laccaria bicolor S238N-H82]|eukprot:XP_001889060.1 predicted protein [Laccaria bicolor S238N-H82]
MPISQETAVRSEERRNTPIIDQQAQVVSDAAPLAATSPVPQQQGFTAETNTVEAPNEHPQHRGVPQRKVSFKERVIGVAQKTRGTILGNPGLKEHGEAILEGKTTHEHDRTL